MGSISEMRCVQRRMVESFGFCDKMISRIKSLAAGSTPAIGSSRIYNFASRAIVMIRQTFSLFPLDSALIRWLKPIPRRESIISALSLLKSGKKSAIYRMTCSTRIQSGKKLTSGKYAVIDFVAGDGRIPFTRILPIVGCSKPIASLMSVDFPLPLGPSKPIIPPEAIFRLTFCNATVEL